MSKLIIGVDPDVEKNGVAYLHKGEKKADDMLQVDALSFFELFDMLKYQKHIKKELEVYIESGWENKSNWHVNPKDTKQLAAYKGNSVGRNHEVGRKIVEMCEYLGIKYTLIRPLKIKGKSGKPTAKYFFQLTGIKVKGDFKQEMIDAGLLIFGR